MAGLPSPRVRVSRSGSRELSVPVAPCRSSGEPVRGEVLLESDKGLRSLPFRPQAEVVTGAHPASFRDPSGFVFERDGVLYRQVNAGYSEHYERLAASGLYKRLTTERLLLPHT